VCERDFLDFRAFLGDFERVLERELFRDFDREFDLDFDLVLDRDFDLVLDLDLDLEIDLESDEFEEYRLFLLYFGAVVFLLLGGVRERDRD